MHNGLLRWWDDVSATLSQVTNESSLSSQLERFTTRLGFEHYSLIARGALSKNSDIERVISNYPALWIDRYRTADYLSIDPTVRIAARSRNAVIWEPALFAKAPELWREAQDFGLHAGIAQSAWGRGGLFTLLSLARGRESVTVAEASELQPFLLMLVECVTAKLQLLIDVENSKIYPHHLSPREIEVLKCTAAGKTAVEISLQLGISNVTVQYHLQNAKRKLGVSTKIQVTDRAKRLGIIP